MKTILTAILLFTGVATFGQNKVWDLSPKDSVYYTPGAHNRVWDMGKVYVATINASDYGFSPDSTGAANILAWYSLPAADIVYISAGTYDIDSTLYWQSNTTYVYANGVEVQKTASFGTIFANQGMVTGIRDENIKVYGNGLVSDLNGNEDENSSTFGTRGIITLYHLDNFVLDSITYTGTGTLQFCVQLCDVTNGLISGIDITSPKDGIDFQGPVSHVTLDGYRSNTGDDAMYLGGHGYYTATPMVGDVHDITIRNWTDSYRASTNSQACRIQSGAWLAWNSGNSYQLGDVITTSDGRIYRKSDSGTETSTVEPTHITGVETLADNVSWRYYQDDTITSAKVYNIRFVNVTLTSNRSLINCTSDSNALYTRTVYWGAWGKNKIDNIVLDSIYYTPNISGSKLFYNMSQNVGKLTVSNTNIKKTNALQYLFSQGESNAVKKVWTDSLVFDNCDLNVGIGGYGITAIIVSASPDLYTSKFNYIKFKDCNLIGETNGANKPLLGGIYYSDILNEIVFESTVIDSCERLTSPVAGCAWSPTITLTNSTIDHASYFLVSTVEGTTVILNATNCVWNTPTNYLFYNSYAPSPMTVTSSGFSGTAVTAKVKPASGGGSYVTKVGDWP